MITEMFAMGAICMASAAVFVLLAALARAQRQVSLLSLGQIVFALAAIISGIIFAVLFAANGKMLLQILQP